ncbi:MAG: hypothetical protein AAGF07_03530 [Patescibacteria group bacterium]
MTQNKQNQNYTSVDKKTSTKNLRSTKNIFLATIIAISSLFFIFALFFYFTSSSAKPSKANKQDVSEIQDSITYTKKEKPGKNIQTPEIKAFEVDDKSQIVVLEKCDLAIKHNLKDSSDLYSTGVFEYDHLFTDETTDKLKFLKSYGVGESFPFGRGFNGVGIKCFDRDFDFSELSTAKYSADPEVSLFPVEPNLDINGNVVVPPAEISVITKDDMCDQVGFTKDSCQVIDSEVTKILKYGIEPSETYYYHFNYKDKAYLIYNYEVSDGTFELQFDSLNPNTSTIEYIGEGDYYYSSDFNKEDIEQENLVDKDKNKKEYTNKYLPGLKLVYPEDWKISTKTFEANYENLVGREITLDKQGAKFSFFTFPVFPTGCDSAGPGYVEPTVEKSFANEYKRYKATDYFGYSTIVDCPLFNKIDSNISAKDHQDYMKIMNVETGNVEFRIRIWAYPNEKVDIAEFDEIFTDSSFS